MTAASALASARHGPSAERVDIDVVLREIDRAAPEAEDRIRIGANCDHVAIQVAIRAGMPMQETTEVRLEENAGLVIVEPGWGIQWHDLVVFGFAGTRGLKDNDFRARKCL